MYIIRYQHLPHLVLSFGVNAHLCHGLLRARKLQLLIAQRLSIGIQKLVHTTLV